MSVKIERLKKKHMEILLRFQILCDARAAPSAERERMMRNLLERAHRVRQLLRQELAAIKPAVSGVPSIAPVARDSTRGGRKSGAPRVRKIGSLNDQDTRAPTKSTAENKPRERRILADIKAAEKVAMPQSSSTVPAEAHRLIECQER